MSPEFFEVSCCRRSAKIRTPESRFLFIARFLSTCRSQHSDGGDRQCLTIAIFFGAKVLILGEPASALGVHQTSVVLKLSVESKARGTGVIFISHNVRLAHVVGDRFTVLQRGRSVGKYNKQNIGRKRSAGPHGGWQGVDQP